MRTLPFLLSVAGLAGSAAAQLQPAWIATHPAGTAFAASFQDLAVDAAGNSYVTGIGGGGSNTNVVTVSFDPSGGLRWARTFDGTQAWHDQGRAIALAPDGTVWVSGNTPGPTFTADVLLLNYDAATGALLRTVQYTSAPNTSESGLDLAIDPAGNLFVAATTVGDGSDVMLVSFDATGAFRWRRTWDGSAFGPFSQDVPEQVQIDPAGDVLLLVTGIGQGSLPDYVVNKYDATSGATIWEASWGGIGNQSPADMAIDAAGDVYVTGTAIDLTDKLSTVKLWGASGALLWQAYDSAGFDDNAFAIALDGLGGVYVTGDSDPEGDDSNFNEDFLTVKRAADDGQLLWTHVYGDPCVGCFDQPTDVLVDPAGYAIVTGVTSSAPYSGAQISFVLDAFTGVEVARSVVTGTPPPAAGSGILIFDGARNWYNGGQTGNSTTGEVLLSVMRHDALGGPCASVASATPVADAAGLNVPGSLDVVPVGNLPTLGSTSFAVGVDDPLGGCGIQPGAATFVFLGFQPASAVVAGQGCGVGAPGEVMVLPTGGLIPFGPAAWSGPGAPAVHPIAVPADPSACGLSVFAQGLFVDLAAPAGQRLSLTNRLDMVLGM